MALTAGKYVVPNGAPSAQKQEMQSAGVGDTEVNLKAEIGWCQLNDDSGAYAYSAGVEEIIQNDGTGYTIFTQLPSGMTSACWDTTNDWLDLSELSAGDTVHFNISLTIDPTTAGQTMQLLVIGRTGESLEWSDTKWRHYEAGSAAFSIHLSGWFKVSSQYGIDFPVQFRFLSDGAGTIDSVAMVFEFHKRVSAY